MSDEPSQDIVTLHVKRKDIGYIKSALLHYADFQKYRADRAADEGEIGAAKTAGLWESMSMNAYWRVVEQEAEHAGADEERNPSTPEGGEV